jgi:hypothetical protein
MASLFTLAARPGDGDPSASSRSPTRSAAESVEDAWAYPILQAAVRAPPATQQPDSEPIYATRLRTTALLASVCARVCALRVPAGVPQAPLGDLYGRMV